MRLRFGRYSDRPGERRKYIYKFIKKIMANEGFFYVWVINPSLGVLRESIRRIERICGGAPEAHLITLH